MASRMRIRGGVRWMCFENVKRRSDASRYLTIVNGGSAWIWMFDYGWLG